MDARDQGAEDVGKCCSVVINFQICLSYRNLLYNLIATINNTICTTCLKLFKRVYLTVRKCLFLLDNTEPFIYSFTCPVNNFSQASFWVC